MWRFLAITAGLPLAAVVGNALFRLAARLQQSASADLILVLVVFDLTILIEGSELEKAFPEARLVYGFVALGCFFRERDPSNLTVEHPAREQARADASLIVAVTNMPSPDALKALGGLVAYHYIEEVFLIASSTHGANNSGPIQQTPKTTARRFEPVAAA